MVLCAADESLFEELHERARRLGLYLILRHERRHARSLVFANGKLESISTTRQAGLGLQAFSRDGRSAFAALDRPGRREALQTLDTLHTACREASRRRYAANREVFRLEPARLEFVPELRFPHDATSLPRLERELGAFHRQFVSAHSDLRLETGLHAIHQQWLVTRTDGSRARFDMPRCILANQLARPGENGSVLSASAGQSRPSYEVLLGEAERLRIERRMERAASLLEQLEAAPHCESGSYPMVIDYALAKGLAHEAFGHASESDSYRNSCLARRGKFRRGEKVAGDHLSIIDEPLEGDHAYQPVSANGVRRERATIVRDGVLEDGLGDVFSARRGGVRLTGAARAESYRHVPLPRMSNIRIEVNPFVPVSGEFEDLRPEDVQALLAREGLLDRTPVAYLTGYRGGQVNSKSGDFVFNCTAIYGLSRDRIRLYRPAIFSGFFLSALAAIKAGFGPLVLDALGTCGKRGQRVPSSGGSHYLLYLERRPDLLVGGRAG